MGNGKGRFFEKRPFHFVFCSCISNPNILWSDRILPKNELSHSPPEIPSRKPAPPQQLTIFVTNSKSGLIYQPHAAGDADLAANYP
jgi:hypothetical protein